MEKQTIKIGPSTVVIKTQKSNNGKIRGTVAIFSKGEKPVFRIIS